MLIDPAGTRTPWRAGRGRTERIGDPEKGRPRRAGQSREEKLKAGILRSERSDRCEAGAAAMTAETRGRSALNGALRRSGAHLNQAGA